MPQAKLDIPIFYGTYADLTRLDLSFMNGSILIYRGKKFRNFFKKILNPKTFASSYAQITSDPQQNNIYENDKVKRYSIVPVDINKPFTQEHFQHFHQLILSIYPSDFTLLIVLHLNFDGDKYLDGGGSYYHFTPTGKNYFDNFMFINKHEYKFVRNYIKKYFYSSYSLSYLKYILSVFSHSFLESSPIHKYLSLIICLEVIVEGPEQLTYRLKRNIALLCGDSKATCKLIYKNVDQLYKLRSAIVHGTVNPSYKNFSDYYDYLKTLVARLIRELVVHNVSSIQTLNEILTSLGFGQNKLISDGYQPSKYPIIDNVTLSFKAIQKY